MQRDFTITCIRVSNFYGVVKAFIAVPFDYVFYSTDCYENIKSKRNWGEGSHRLFKVSLKAIDMFKYTL